MNPGDEVIVPAPYWVSYPEMVKLAEGKPVIVTAGIEQDFKITPAQLEVAITPKTKALILCSPFQSPLALYIKGGIAGLVAVLAKHPQVIVIADEIYEPLEDGRFLREIDVSSGFLLVGTKRVPLQPLRRPDRNMPDGDAVLCTVLETVVPVLHSPLGQELLHFASRMSEPCWSAICVSAASYLVLLSDGKQAPSSTVSRMLASSFSRMVCTLRE